MAHLDKNGIAVAVGQSVRLKFPGTDDFCVGRVVGIDFNGIDIEAEHFGSKQSVTVRADTLEYVANDLIASLEVRLEAARNAVVSTTATVEAAQGAQAEAARRIDLAAEALKDAINRKSQAEQLVDLLEHQLAEAKVKLAEEEAAKAEHGADPNTVAATDLQVTTEPIIPSPALPTIGPVGQVDPTLPSIPNPDIPA